MGDQILDMEALNHGFGPYSKKKSAWQHRSKALAEPKKSNRGRANFSESALTPLIGKKIRLHGTVNVQKGFGLQRPEIQLKDRAALELSD